MSEPTGHHDINGIPIHCGDLIRVKHFLHYRNRRQMYLYFRVAQKGGRFVVKGWDNIEPEHHQCLLEHCGVETAEVLADDGLTDEMFCERKRVKA